MTGFESLLFRQRLVSSGYDVRQFQYHSWSAGPDAVLSSLHDELLAMRGPVNLVGHSLGGLLMLRLVASSAALPIARVVLLGAPVNGSRAARWFLRFPGTSLLFGRFAREELLSEDSRRVPERVPVGTIAGSLAIGLPHLFGELDTPNDGTVSVSETALEGAADSIVLPLSHTGLMMSPDAAEATISFLETGRFSRSGP
jgi:pimeloyl-ACP methyl ester carboxylesterase